MVETLEHVAHVPAFIPWMEDRCVSKTHCRRALRLPRVSFTLMLVSEDAEGKAESIRSFARPWPVVKLFREYMERNLRPDPVPDALWELPASKARQ